MKAFFLKIVLKSDAAFGRGDGIAGIIDNEVQHDELGCPYLSGKEIKGILAEECAGILAALKSSLHDRWYASAARLFGQAGSLQGDEACLMIGDARLPDDLRSALAWDLNQRLETIRKDDPDYEQRKRNKMNKFRTQTLNSLTSVRQQTAMDEKTGAAKDHSLRATRVVIRNTPFVARLDYRQAESEAEQSDDLALLAACVAAFRRAGAGRNRGMGRLIAELEDDQGIPIQKDYLEKFVQEVVK